MPKLVLFDIDGTLVLTGGAGLRAMNRAFDEVIGAPTGLTGANSKEALDGIPVAGRTDWSILQDTLARVGRELDQPLLGQLRERYVTHLRDEILRPGKGFNGTLPGVSVLLDALEPREDVYLGLLTGNFQRWGPDQARAFRPLALLPVWSVWRRLAGSQRAGAGRGRPRHRVRDAVVRARRHSRRRRHAE